MATISVLGVDLGKNVCSVVGFDGAGKVVMRRKVRREIGLAAKLPPCIVAIGSLLRRLSSRSGVRRSRSRRPATRICPALHQGSEERQS